MPILQAAIKTNQDMAETICDRLLSGSNSGETIGILGLAFKPFTDDVRDTPAARIIACLRKRGVKSVLAYDPLAEKEFLSHYPELDVCCPGNLDEVVKKSDRMAIVTAWPEFAEFCDYDNVWDFRYMCK